MYVYMHVYIYIMYVCCGIWPVKPLDERRPNIHVSQMVSSLNFFFNIAVWLPAQS